MTMSTNVLMWKSGVWTQGTGSPPSPVQIALSRPYCGWPSGAPGVDEAPDDRRADERDRERQEDERLGDRLVPDAVDEGGDEQAEADRARHAHDEPEDVVEVHLVVLGVVSAHS